MQEVACVDCGSEFTQGTWQGRWSWLCMDCREARKQAPADPVDHRWQGHSMITGGFFNNLNGKKHRAARYLHADYLNNLHEVDDFEAQYPLPFNQWLARTLVMFNGGDEWFKQDTPDRFIGEDGFLKEGTPVFEAA